MARRDALEASGGFDEGLSHAEDLDLWIRLARRWPAAASRRALVRYQHRPGGLAEVRVGLEEELDRLRQLDRRRARQLLAQEALLVGGRPSLLGQGLDEVLGPRLE